MSIFFVLCVLAVIPSCFAFVNHSRACNVLPKDPYIEVGSSIDIMCQTSCTRGKIYWTLNNSPINQTLSVTVNSTHTLLSLRNFTHYKALLKCHSEDTKQILGGTVIRTISKPTNISCVLYNENQESFVPKFLNCSWQHQKSNTKQHKVNYTVLCASPPGGLSKKIYETHDTQFKVNESHCIIINQNFTITVKAQTAAWETQSKSYSFYPYHILKMNHPKIQAAAAVSSSVLVEWKRSPQSETCHCQVKYSKVQSGFEGSTEWVLDKTLNPRDNGNVTIEKLESCTNYRFSVRCALEGAPWSDWSQENTVLTKLNKSHVKLHLWRKVSEPEKYGVRRVHVMWADIFSTCEGTFDYFISQIPQKQHSPGMNVSYTSCANSSCDVYVDQHAHRINLTIFHDDVLLAKDSVYVPAVGETLPQVTNIQTSTHEGTILLSWEAPAQPVNSYMIDWTHNMNQYDWKESKYTNTTLSGLLDKQPYNITVTPLFDDKTSHGKQALHICSSLGGPGNVDISSVQAYDKTAEVRWETKSQDACSSSVIRYTVFYSTEEGPLLNVTVDNNMKMRKEQSIFLKGLNPDTDYRVYVEATALVGNVTSAERLFKTTKFDPRLITALIMYGSILIVLMCSVGSCCVILWKKFTEMPVPNPGLSSVALWPNQQKEPCPFLPFSNPTESLCDRVYTEGTPPSNLSLTTGSDQTDEYTDSAFVLTPTLPNERPAGPAETPRLSSMGESTALLLSESSRVTPYRTQSSVETPAQRGSKQCKRVPGKQPEKTALKTIYVTLDMFEEGQSR